MPKGSALADERSGTLEHDLAILDPQRIIQWGKGFLFLGWGQRCACAHQLDRQHDGGEADVTLALQGRTDDIVQAMLDAALQALGFVVRFLGGLYGTVGPVDSIKRLPSTAR